MERNTFVERWATALETGSGAAFIGAGLSQRAGYPGWRALLRDIARELGLDAANEHDLAAVAQYHINRRTGKRNQLAQLIVREFPPKTDVPEPFRLLARLPLRHVWTTNYDALIETAWRQARKGMHVRSRNDDLGVPAPWADTDLYKMHGTVEHPTEVVIATDDYERYRSERGGFLRVLEGQLIGHQFVFLGFSFTDPNLARLFGNLRETFRENGPEHYALVRRPKRDQCDTDAQFATARTRYQLWVEDLRRYGIECVELDEYAEVDDVLRAVETRLARRSVMVSGSFPEDAGDPQLRALAEAVARGVGRLVAERGQRLVSGFGLTVGSAAVAGALGVVLQRETPSLDRALLLRPFPQETPAGYDLATFRRLYREDLVAQAGACVFIAGVRALGLGRTSETETAPGVLEEFEAALAAGRSVIPVGATGGAAAELWRRVEADFSARWPSDARPHFERLADARQQPDDLVAAVGALLDFLRE